MKEEKEALLGSARHSRVVGQDYLYKTGFSSGQRQKPRTLRIKHWCYCPNRTLSVTKQFCPDLHAME